MMHGGRLAEARRLFPDAPEPILDLSTGINPVAYPLPPLQAELFTRLPEPEQVEALERTAAAAYGVAGREMVVAAPGTQILIDLLPRLWRFSPVAVLGPTYAEYARSWARAGCRVACVADFASLHEAGTAVVCNPNNPDGRRIPADRLVDLADRLAARRGILVIDEAFADFEGKNVSLATALPHPAVIVLRSFGKAYGLAGLRLGFALAAPERATAIREALGPWAVSGPAIAIGQLALSDKVWLSAAAARLARDARLLDTCLTGAGLRVRGGTALFRLAETEDAAVAFLRLGRAGIFVRRFRERPAWLRFGVPCRESDIERIGLALRVLSSLPWRHDGASSPGHTGREMREETMARFQDKIVLISGGARGQGAAEARMLVAEGARVVVGDVLEADGRRLAEELGEAAVFLRQDVTEEADWIRAVEAAERLGGLHGMVNNAGIYVPATLLETDVALFERHMRINQLGCFLGMKTVAGAMERAGGGSIVNISSVAGLRGSPGAIAYSATKWALRGMTKAAAIELAPRGIRVNSVHPGPIDTEMLKVRTPEQNAQRVRQVPMKRMGTAEEVAKLVLFLLAEDSAYITGAEVSIDGGVSL